MADGVFTRECSQRNCGECPDTDANCCECRCHLKLPAAPGPKFVNIGASVMRGPESIAACRSVSMAKRIAAALNWYKPGPRGT